MGLLDRFWKPTPRTAAMAKDRLSIIVARERRGSGGIDYMAQLKQELLAVLSKYEKIDLDQVSVNVEKSGECDVLELNVVVSALTPPEELASIFP